MAKSGRRASLAVLVLVTTVACRDAAPPPYVRLSGRAPALAETPASRATLVVFWATWCAPCREGSGALEQLAKSPPAGLKIVVVSEDHDMDAVRAFLGGPPPSEWHLRVDEGQTAFQAFGVEKLPAAFLVARGELVARFSGPHDWTSRGMRRLLERLLREGSGGPP